MTTDKQVADSLTTQGKTASQDEAPPQTIIMPVVPTETQFAVDLINGSPIIQSNTDGGSEGIIRDAEERRQTVQAEAMVNLAVGVALMTFGALTDPRGNRVGGHVKVSPKDLEEFQHNYTVTQEVRPDGGFIISVTPKEV